MNSDNILSLVGFNANVQLAHWQADTKTNTHEALGKLYEGMVALTDDLAEISLGKNGNREFQIHQIVLTPNTDLSGLIQLGLSILEDIRAELKVGIDDDLLNIVADMSAIINKTKYLLEL